MARLVLLLSVLALALPAAAQAGTVTLEADEMPYGTVGKLVYRAAPGERNNVTVEAYDGNVVLTDTAGVSPGRGCRRQSRRAAICSIATPEGDRADLNSARLYLGDRDDVVHSVRGSQGVIEVGGTGDDRLVGGVGDFNHAGYTRFVGGPGRDVMRGRSAGDVFDEGARPSGADTMGPSGGWVDYGRRRARVFADLDGERDDGERGERDLLGRGVYAIRGGDASDRLAGNAEANALGGGPGADVLIGGGGNDALIATDVGPPRLVPVAGVPGDGTADRISGGPGTDLLEGSNGPNLIDAGPGPDQIWALGGADRIRARDTDTDQLGCGAGWDRVWNDVIDFRTDCERATASPPGAVPISAYGYIADRDPEPYRAAIGVGCSVKVPCTGSLELRFSGQVVATARFSVTPPGGRLAIGYYRTEVFFTVTREVLALLEERNPQLSVVAVTDGSGVRRETSVEDLVGDVGLALPSLPRASL